MNSTRNLTATFADTGFKSPVVVKGDYPGRTSHMLVGLTHNHDGCARVLFIHDCEPVGAKMVEAHDPWSHVEVYEHVRLSQVAS